MIEPYLTLLPIPSKASGLRVPASDWLCILDHIMLYAHSRSKLTYLSYLHFVRLRVTNCTGLMLVFSTGVKPDNFVALKRNLEARRHRQTMSF